MDELKVKVITDGDQLRDIRDEWNRLLERSQSASIFLTWEWLYNWWLYFGRDVSLRVVIVKDSSDKTVGIAPLCIRRKQGLLPVYILTFMGASNVSSEYLDLIVEPGYEIDVMDKLFKIFEEDQNSWDYIVFSDMLDSSVLMRYSEKHLRREEYLVRREISQSCPYLPLPTKKEDFYNSLGKETRATLKRRTKKLLEVGAEIRTVKDDGEMSEALESLFQLHQKRWTLRGLRGNFHDKQIRSFHLDTASRFLSKDMLRLYQISVDDNTIASLYCFRYKGRVFYFQAGFDPAWGAKSPGTVLMGYGIQDSIVDGNAEFDFLRGVEAYKFKWTNKVRYTWSIKAVSRENIKGLLVLRLDLAISEVKNQIKRFLVQEKPLRYGSAILIKI